MSDPSAPPPPPTSPDPGAGSERRGQFIALGVLLTLATGLTAGAVLLQGDGGRSTEGPTCVGDGAAAAWTVEARDVRWVQEYDDLVILSTYYDTDEPGVEDDIYAIDGSGDEAWHYANADLFGAPTASSNLVITRDDLRGEEGVGALDAATGDELWWEDGPQPVGLMEQGKRVATQVLGDPPEDEDDETNGNERWPGDEVTVRDTGTGRSGAEIPGRALAVSDDRILVATDETLRLLDSSGSEIWSIDAAILGEDFATYTAEAVITDEVVAVVTDAHEYEDRRGLVLDAATGDPVIEVTGFYDLIGAGAADSVIVAHWQPADGDSPSYDDSPVDFIRFDTSGEIARVHVDGVRRYRIGTLLDGDDARLVLGEVGSVYGADLSLSGSTGTAIGNACADGVYTTDGSTVSLHAWDNLTATSAEVELESSADEDGDDDDDGPGIFALDGGIVVTSGGEATLYR